MSRKDELHKVLYNSRGPLLLILSAVITARLYTFHFTLVIDKILFSIQLALTMLLGVTAMARNSKREKTDT
jgi:hypothetical protein